MARWRFPYPILSRDGQQDYLKTSISLWGALQVVCFFLAGGRAKWNSFILKYNFYVHLVLEFLVLSFLLDLKLAGDINVPLYLTIWVNGKCFQLDLTLIKLGSCHVIKVVGADWFMVAIQPPTQLTLFHGRPIAACFINVQNKMFTSPILAKMNFGDLLLKETPGRNHPTQQISYYSFHKIKSTNYHFRLNNYDFF